MGTDEARLGDEGESLQGETNGIASTVHVALALASAQS